LDFVQSSVWESVLGERYGAYVPTWTNL